MNNKKIFYVCLEERKLFLRLLFTIKIFYANTDKIKQLTPANPIKRSTQHLQNQFLSLGVFRFFIIFSAIVSQSLFF